MAKHCKENPILGYCFHRRGAMESLLNSYITQSTIQADEDAEKYALPGDKRAEIIQIIKQETQSLIDDHEEAEEKYAVFIEDRDKLSEELIRLRAFKENPLIDQGKLREDIVALERKRGNLIRGPISETDSRVQETNFRLPEIIRDEHGEKHFDL